MSNAGHVRNADAIECNSEETVSPPVSPVASVRGELWTPCSSFQLGDTIEANWRLSGKYYMGVVTATNDDETFAIQYVDGDSENRVAAKSIRAVHARRRGATAAAAGAPGQRKEGGSNLDKSNQPPVKRPKATCTASSSVRNTADAIDPRTIPLDLQLQVWQGSGPILASAALGHRRSSLEFHDVFGSALSPARQNEVVLSRAVAKRDGIEVPRVLSETPHYYRKQHRFETQEKYVKYSKTAVEIEAEVDYELDQDDDQWLAALNEGLRDQRTTASQYPLSAQYMEVLIDRFEKADAKMHKMLGHSAARVEVLMTDRTGFTGISNVSDDIQEQVHQWWCQKRNKTGQQLLRRFRAPPDPDDPDIAKPFRRVSPFRSQMRNPHLSHLTRGNRDNAQIQVGDIVEANWHGRGNYYSGLVAAVNPNGTYAIKYDDGDCEDNIGADAIRTLGRRRGVRTSSVAHQSSDNSPSKQQSSRARASTRMCAARLPIHITGKVNSSGKASARSVSVPSATTSTPSFHIGDQVEATFSNGGVFGATITEVHDNGARFTIDRDDGGTRNRVLSREQIFPVGTHTRLRIPARENQYAGQVSDSRSDTSSQTRSSSKNLNKPTSSSASRKRARAHSTDRATDNLISAEEALLLQAGDRVLYKWQEPGGKDDGVWYAATVGKRLGSTDRYGWFELQFDQFTVSNAHSWNLPHHANRGGLRRASSVAANRVRRGSGAPALEWSKALGGGVGTAGGPQDIDTGETRVAYSTQQPTPAASNGVAERKLIGKWRKSSVKPRERAAEGTIPAADDTTADDTWRLLWAALMNVGWRNERFLGGAMLYFPPCTLGEPGGRTFFDTKAAVLSYLAQRSAQPSE